MDFNTNNISEKKIRVLWFSATAAMYDEQKYGGWIASLELAINRYCENIQLGIAFEYSSQRDKIIKHNVVYYPSYFSKNKIERIKGGIEWEKMKNCFINVVNEFRPDVIQCFGTEWPYALIQENVDIPVIIHMQGFLNIYSLSNELAYSAREKRYSKGVNFKAVLGEYLRQKHLRSRARDELKIMDICQFFLGRTEWDKNIVKHFSPKAKYFYCSEVLRPEIYFNDNKWKYSKSDEMRIVTISQAGGLKGNEIILRTARILKEQFEFPFQWHIAGNINSIIEFERKTKIHHSDVNIKLLGMISAKEIVDELCNANIYVHPAIIDNSPNSLCEAQVLGCPVISANVGGISDFVENNVTGFLYPYNEPYALAFKIMDLYEKGELLQQISRNERQIALERHNPKIIAENLQEIYQIVIKSKNQTILEDNIGEKSEK